MKNKLFKMAMVAILLAACTAPDDHTGEVVAFNGNFMTISGAMNQVKGVPGFSPTPAMQAKANEVCGNSAKFEGTTESNPTSDSFVNSFFIGYNFICL